MSPVKVSSWYKASSSCYFVVSVYISYLLIPIGADCNKVPDIEDHSRLDSSFVLESFQVSLSKCSGYTGQSGSSTNWSELRPKT